MPPVNRMAYTLLALVGLLISLYLTLHKLGYIGSLLCGTGSCEVVQTSKWAVFMGVPVPYLGMFGYALMTVLGIISLQPQHVENRMLRGGFDRHRTGRVRLFGLSVGARAIRNPRVVPLVHCLGRSGDIDFHEHLS